MVRSSSFSLCTWRPFSSCSAATIFFVATSIISPVEEYANRPSMLKLTQPTQSRAFMLVTCLGGITVASNTWMALLAQSPTQSSFSSGVKRHGCPSHGIALTPDEKELWVGDCANSAIHVFDATVMPPKQVTSIKARDCVGWVSFSMDGRFAYSSTGEIIEVATKKIVAALQDENGLQVQSEKLLDLTIANGKVVRAGNQFGVGAPRMPQTSAGR